MTTLVAVADSAALAAALAASGVLLVDFHAAWCEPCHALEPVLAELAEEQQPVLRIMTVDVAEHPQLGDSYAVQTLPTLLFFVNGQVVSRLHGTRTKRQLVRELHDAIAAGATT